MVGADLDPGNGDNQSGQSEPERLPCHVVDGKRQGNGETFLAAFRLQSLRDLPDPELTQDAVLPEPQAEAAHRTSCRRFAMTPRRANLEIALFCQLPVARENRCPVAQNQQEQGGP